MNLIDHPSDYTGGTRVLFLKGRRKDDLEDQRTVIRVTHDEEKFHEALAELVELARPGERIYGSAGSRDVKAAARFLKERMLANDYDQDPLDFYRKLEARWASCLMSPRAQECKLWLFDCDDAETATSVEVALVQGRLPLLHYYRTKNGRHFITAPFDRRLLGEEHRRLIHDNPIMLWGWA